MKKNAIHQMKKEAELPSPPPPPKFVPYTTGLIRGKEVKESTQDLETRDTSNGTA